MSRLSERHMSVTGMQEMLYCCCCPHRRYQDVCLSENFWGLASRGAQDKAKVHMLSANNLYQSDIPLLVQSTAEYQQKFCG